MSFEYELARIDGSHIRVRTSMIPDLGIDGEVAGCFELTFDNTEHQRAQELVIRAQKMEALGALTGGLAHDFNNLLTVVIGNLGRLAELRNDDQTTLELVTPALKAAQHGAELIRRLLSFARRQPLQAVSVDAVQALANVVQMTRGSLPQTLQIEVQAGAQALWTCVDPSELETALLNLLINARDATAGDWSSVATTMSSSPSSRVSWWPGCAASCAVAPCRLQRLMRHAASPVLPAARWTAPPTCCVPPTPANTCWAPPKCRCCGRSSTARSRS